ncbi:MAG: tetratricopeptide repeat protein [Mesorhizobium sp.]|uniref:tetratricopeptide repeat protein n=1 Tax=Mesorhizobium sp. TaxID=1871066 RepID=UPI000FE57EAC|nr:hypothetical protein [Mesorhizobium sp.]RWM88741.1 MAG: tetratricopeptide repeat protein [Mesorhizobium sp.]
MAGSRMVLDDRGTSMQKWALPVAAVAVFFTGLNAGSYFLAPALFEADTARGPYTVANNYELTRVYSRALDSYAQVVQDFPDSRYYDPARIGIANSLMALGRRSEAIAEYEKLLTSLTDNNDLRANRLTVLTKLAHALEEDGDTQRFQAVFELLSKEYPDSAATKDAKRFADTISAAAQASDSQSAQSDLVKVEAEAAIVGAPFKISVTVMPEAVPPGQFSVAINSSFVAQFDLVSVAPTSGGTADYWGKRFYQFRMDGGQPFEAVFTFKPKAAGTHSLDLDLESNFSLIELNQLSSIDVAGQ